MGTSYVGLDTEAVKTVLRELGLSEQFDPVTFLHALKNAWGMDYPTLGEILGNAPPYSEKWYELARHLLLLKAELTACTDESDTSVRHYREKIWLTTYRSAFAHQTPCQVLAQGKPELVERLVEFLRTGDVAPEEFCEEGHVPSYPLKKLPWRPEDGRRAELGYRTANLDAPVDEQYLEPVSLFRQLKGESVLWDLRQRPLESVA